MEAEIRQLRQDNNKYLQWLTQTPTTIPFFEHALEVSKAEISRLGEEISNLSARIDPIPSPSPTKKRYSVSKALKLGESFIDDRTGAILGFVTVGPDFKGEVHVSVPGKPPETLKGITAGASWEFTKGEQKYRLSLSRLDWFSNSAEVVLQESE